jgi:glyoxylate utilization-related uncharacterized protein
MPKNHPVRKRARQEGGEYVLGLEDLATHACYLIYGELQPGEGGRKVCPGDGHEEILLAVQGDLAISGGGLDRVLAEGEAVHLEGEQACEIANPGASVAVYVMAGGHPHEGH